MADNEEGERSTSRGNEWEVVSLTASAYAAAPGPKQVEMKDDDKSEPVGEDKGETSEAIFMSGHFVFPPNQHENLPIEPENTKIDNEQGGEDADTEMVAEEADTEMVVEEADTEMVAEEGGKSGTKDDDNWNIKGLTVPDDLPEIPVFDEKGKKLSITGEEFDECMTLQGLDIVDKEQSMYSAEEFSSFHSEATIVEDNRVITEPIEPSDQGVDAYIPHVPKPADEDKHDGSDFPSEAWLKRKTAALYAQAKEANPLWSIFIAAAAVMGLAIIGRRWQQERWQVLQLKYTNDERIGMMLSPLSRFKDTFVGGSRRGSSIRGSTATGR